MPDDMRIVMYTITGGFNIPLRPTHLTVLNTPISMSVIAGISHTSLSCWRFNRLFDVHQMTQTPDIFSLVDAAWKHTQYPCFCILPLESTFAYVNMKTVRFYVQTTVNLQRKSLCTPECKNLENMLIDFIWLNVQAKYVLQNDVILLWIRYGYMKVSQSLPKI